MGKISPLDADPGTKSRSQSSSRIISNLVMITVIMTVITALFIFLKMSYVIVVFIFGFAPSIAAYIFDRRPKRYGSKTIVAFNIAGMVPHLFAFIHGENPNSVAQAMFSNIYVWLTVYGFAGFGWILVHMIPQLAFLVLVVRSDHSIQRLKEQQQALVDEWGEGIRNPKAK